MAIKLNTSTQGATQQPQTFQQGATFSDQQKQELAKSVGFSGEYDPTMFNKEFDPTTGQNKLYIKVGGNKIFGQQPQAQQASVQQQASYMQQQFGNRSIDDIYSSILAARPTDTDIQVALGQQTGLSQQIAGARAQMDEIQRRMLGDQSAIFNATNPDGTPIDPRLKVAQYQQNMQGYMNRLDQLQKLESTYKAELQTLSEAEKNRIEQENKRNLTALQYLKDMNEQKRQEEQFAFQKEQFQFQKEKEAFTQQKPEWKQDTATGQWINMNAPYAPGTSLSDFTGTLQRNVNGTTNNVGQDTNNPGNIMVENEAGRDRALRYGAVGFYTSPNGRTYAVFPDMQTGMAAARADLQAKLTGGSSWATGDTTLAKFASGWTSGPNAPLNQSAVSNYARLTGYDPNTKIKDIPVDTLLNAIVANEGVNPNRSARIAAPTIAGAEVSYAPERDMQLTPVGSMAGDTMYADARTGTTISGAQARQLYGQQATGARGGGLADDINLRTARITTSIYGKAASDTESKRIAKIIQNNPNATDNDIMDAATGFTYPQQYATVAGNIRSVLTQSGVEKLQEKLPGLGRQLQEGNIGAAVRAAENYSLAQINKDNLGNEKIREDKIKVAVTLAKDLQSLVDSGKKAVGPIDGTIEEWLGRFKGAEAQTISRKIRELTAKMRNELSGTAVTASEAQFLSPIIPELYDTEANMNDKIRGLRKNPLSEYNRLRELGGLPQLNETSLFDMSQRAKQYNGEKVTLPLQNQNIILESIKSGGGDANLYIQDLQSKGYDTSFIQGNQYTPQAQTQSFSGAGTTQQTAPIGLWQQQNKGRIIK